MAGEWLKVECSTPDKPEVLALTVKLGWDDPDLTVGKLFRLWRWFDQQTTDGNAVGVTPALLDRLIGVTGFVQAVADVGWLFITPSGISLSKFDLHNGTTAKSRAQTAKRVANHRCNAPSNADAVTEALAREEKRREEEEKCTHTPLREGWVLPKAYGDWAIAEFPHWTAETVRSIAATFADHWRASGGSSADWDATWRKWCRDPLTQKAHPAPKASVVKAVAAAPPKTVPSNSAEQTKALLRQQEEHAAEVERQRLARIAKRTQQEAA